MSDTTARTAVWRGLNRMPYIEDGQMRSMKNLSSDAYPYLTTRKGREEYKLTVYVPGVAGDGYLEDVKELPDASEQYAGEIVKVTGVLPEETYIPGEFYYYSDGKWVKGKNNENFVGVVENVDDKYKVSEFEKTSLTKNEWKYADDIIKYMGETVGDFEKGKTYQYTLHKEQYWVEISGSMGTSGTSKGNRDSIEAIKALEQAENYQYAVDQKWYFRYTGETTDEFTYGKYYRNYYRGYTAWKEIEDFYEPVETMPENSTEGVLVRFIGSYAGNAVEKAYYTCCEEIYSGETLYFYIKSDLCSGEYVKQTELPVADAEKLGITYYSGTTADMYYICEWDADNSTYDWKVTTRPQVAKNLTLGEYLTDYQKIGLTKIIEIGQLLGKLAVLFVDGSGKICLYYEQKLFPVKDVSELPGKKLQTVGSRLIVGESGRYLYRDKETKELTMHSAGTNFSKTVRASYVEYAPGKYKNSYIDSDGDGEFEIKIIAPGGKGIGYAEVAEGLGAGEATGVDFKIEFEDKVYYLKLTSSTYEPMKEVGGYFTGSRTVVSYADILTIEATGMNEPFYWSDEKGHGLDITISSTTSYLPDVVAWKKRLWGYNENYVQGTAQDIFGEGGNIDWTTGDNTYTEPISQPIWQGGEITGLAALSSALILFKEDSLTVFTGNYPAIMQGSTIPCRGLSSENRESVAVANETVYYLSQDGVYRFTGGLPRCISGETKIKGSDARGASDGRKYWLSVKEDDGNYALYVYDIALGIWHKEDATEAVSFVMLGSKMYMATETQIFDIDAQQEEVPWEAELWYDEGTYKFKKYKGFEVRGNLGDCEVYLKADDGEWQAYAFTENKLSIKAEPFMCRELSIKIKGKGICELKSLDRTYEVVG